MRLLILFLLPILSFAQNQIPSITIQSVTPDLDNQSLEIIYDLIDPDDAAIAVSFRASGDQGVTFAINTAEATGDLGAGISPGTNKTISWNYGSAYPSGGPLRVKLVADDGFQIDIQDLVDQVDSNRLRNNVEFVEGIRHRITGNEQLEAVKDSMENCYLANGLIAYRQDFPFGGYTGQNIIGDLIGTTSETDVYIIDGHFDSVSVSPGADDNGSAVAGVLEAVQVLSAYAYEKTIRFIGFDLEEEGLDGSLAYVANGIGAAENIEGVLNFEMIGYFSDEPNSQTLPTGFDILYPDAYQAVESQQFRGNFITNVASEFSDPLRMAFDAAAETYAPGLRVIPVLAFGDFIPPDLLRSDHAPFWAANIPALQITDSANFRNPNYHTPNDLSTTLNYTFLQQVVQTTIATVAELAGIQHASFTTADLDIPVSTRELTKIKWKVAPNPASDILRVEVHNHEHVEGKIQLFHSSGVLVWESAEGAQFPHIEIKTDHLPRGSYWVSILHPDFQLTKKVIIQ